MTRRAKEMAKEEYEREVESNREKYDKQDEMQKK
jgi:hypothetical protein